MKYLPIISTNAEKARGWSHILLAATSCLLLYVPSPLLGGSILDVPAGNDFVDVSVFDKWAVALRANGSLAVWGDTPWVEGMVEIPSGNNYASISAGYLHGLAGKKDGSVVGWGINTYGSIDIPNMGTTPCYYTIVSAGGNHSLALRNTSHEPTYVVGEPYAWGWNDNGQCTIPAGLTPDNTHAIAAGAMHSLALDTMNRIYAWGDNRYGQSTLPADIEPGPGVEPLIYADKISAGWWHNLAIENDNIYAWGLNNQGQCDVPELARSIPGGGGHMGFEVPQAIAAGEFHSLALVQVKWDDGYWGPARLMAWGDNSHGECNVPSPQGQWVAFDAGNGCSVAIDAAGSAYLGGHLVAWGGEIPEPATICLLGLGSLALLRKRRT